MSTWPRRRIIQMYQLATGRRFLTRLDELNRTQWLGRKQLLALQRRKLYRLLAYAYKYVPYYHRLFDQRGFRPDDVLADVTNLRRLPVLTKDVIRQNFDDMQTTESGRRKHLIRMSTSGSTGHVLIFMQDSNSRDYVTADLCRHHGWGGCQLGDPHCYVWGLAFDVTALRVLRTRLMDIVLNRSITNAFVLTDESLSAFVADIRRRRPRLLHGYPANVCHFAEFVRERGMSDISFDAIFVGAEVVHANQRQLIEEVFKGRVFNRYAAMEAGGISCECGAHVGMHVSVENNYLEILRDGQPADPGELGDILITNLNNYGMPFIRYATGDVGAWSTSGSCPCGRELPMMDLMQGRRTDTFKTRDGRSVWVVIGDSSNMRGVKQFQIVQKSLDLVVVRIVKYAEMEQDQFNSIEHKVKATLGDDVEVRFEFPDEIPVLDSGKYRYAICEVPDQVVTGCAAVGAAAAGDSNSGARE